MKTTVAAAVSACLLLSAGDAGAQGRSYATVTEFTKRELGMPLAGLGLHLSLSPESSGKGRWDARAQELVIDHPLRNRPLIAEAALKKLAGHCQARGGRLEHELKAAFVNSEGKEIIVGRSPRMGVHSCKREGAPLFEMAVSTSPRTKTTFTGLDGSLMTDEYEPIDYSFQLREGEFTEARETFAAFLKTQAAEHEGLLVERAQSEAQAVEADAALAAFRSKLAPGDQAKRGPGRVLVVEVKPPLALVQPQGEPTTWVRIDELRPE